MFTFAPANERFRDPQIITANPSSTTADGSGTAIYDKQFSRMWEFYLISSQLAFLNGSEMIFHLVLANNRDAVSIVRDYMVDDERALQNV